MQWTSTPPKDDTRTQGECVNVVRGVLDHLCLRPRVCVFRLPDSLLQSTWFAVSGAKKGGMMMRLLFPAVSSIFLCSSSAILNLRPIFPIPFIYTCLHTHTHTYYVSVGKGKRGDEAEKELSIVSGQVC